MSGTSVYLSCLSLLVFVRIRKHRKLVQSTRIRETIQKERELVTNNNKEKLGEFTARDSHHRVLSRH